MCTEEVAGTWETDGILIRGDDYSSFGWSSPWPMLGKQPYRIHSIDRDGGVGAATILYYAATSDPHLTVWAERVNFDYSGTSDASDFRVTEETLRVLDAISTGADFYTAYPGGIISDTMMDYATNGLGEALNANAPAQGLPLYDIDSALRTLLNLSEDPAVVVTEALTPLSSTGEQPVRIYFADGMTADVLMVQPYGIGSIWVPQSAAGSEQEEAAQESEATTHQFIPNNAETPSESDGEPQILPPEFITETRPFSPPSPCPQDTSCCQ